MSGIKAKSTRQRISQFVRIGLILAPLLIGWMIQQQLSPTAARPRAMATTFNVAAGDAAGLIAAINAANNETANPGPDTIVLAGGTYTFSAADNLWYGPNVLPAIASAITIEGNGATLQIGGNPTRRRFFFIGANPAANSTRDFLTPGAGHLTLRNLTLKGGRQRGGDSHLGGGGAGLGGAIFNQGRLTLDGVTLTENRVTGGNSLATDPTESTDTPSEGGGGLAGGARENFRSGGMADSDSSISEASFPSGSQGGLVSPPGARTGSGGGGFSPTPRGDGLQGTFTVAGNGGGIRDGLGGDGGSGALPKGLSGYGSGGGAGSGGVLDERVILINRRGNFGMGGLNSFPPFTILGGGGGGVGGGGGMGESGGGGGFGGGGGKGGIAGGNGGFGGGGGAATLGESHGGFGAGRGTGGGTAGTGGGGAGMGGAIFNHGGTLTAVNCTFTANHAQGGSSRFTDDANGSGFGGAIFNLNGSITLRFCTLANNTVAAGSAIEGAADGGAVYNLGYNLLTGQSAGVTLDHSILANSSNRGAVANDLVIHQPRNVSPATGGGANRATSFLVFVNRNLVMRRLLDNGTLGGPAPLTGDPLLGALQSNGGLTLTMLPQAGSPVINAGINADAPASDQRGIARPQGQFTDLGAVEVVPPPCPTITIQARP